MSIKPQTPPSAANTANPADPANAPPVPKTDVAETPGPAEGTLRMQTDYVPARELRPHPRSLEHFEIGNDADLEGLRAQIKARGIRRPLLVTGEGCASGPNVVLGGCRRRHLAEQLGMDVPIVRVANLTADEEEEAVIADNIGDQDGRKLKPSKKAELEVRLREIYARAPGFRSDLKAGIGTNPSEPVAGKTDIIVAQKTGEPVNGIRDRNVVFQSAATTEVLKKSVDEGKISTTVAANIVRKETKKPEVKKAISNAKKTASPGEADLAVIEKAKTRVDAAAKAALEKKATVATRGRKGVVDLEELIAAAWLSEQKLRCGLSKVSATDLCNEVVFVNVGDASPEAVRAAAAEVAAIVAPTLASTSPDIDAAMTDVYNVRCRHFGSPVDLAEPAREPRPGVKKTGPKRTKKAAKRAKKAA